MDETPVEPKPNVDVETLAESVAEIERRTQSILDVEKSRSLWSYIRNALWVLGGVFVIVSVVVVQLRTQELSKSRLTTAESVEAIAIGIRNQNVQLQNSSDDIKAILGVAAELNSPEAQARTAARLDQIVRIVDCDNRETLTEFVESLEAEGVIPQGSVDLTCDPPPDPLVPFEPVE